MLEQYRRSDTVGVGTIALAPATEGQIPKVLEQYRRSDKRIFDYRYCCFYYHFKLKTIRLQDKSKKFIEQNELEDLLQKFLTTIHGASKESK